MSPCNSSFSIDSITTITYNYILRSLIRSKTNVFQNVLLPQVVHVPSLYARNYMYKSYWRLLRAYEIMLLILKEKFFLYEICTYRYRRSILFRNFCLASNTYDTSAITLSIFVLFRKNKQKEKNQPSCGVMKNELKFVYVDPSSLPFFFLFCFFQIPVGMVHGNIKQ